jgi:hypothetical protein
MGQSVLEPGLTASASPALTSDEAQPVSTSSAGWFVSLRWWWTAEPKFGGGGGVAGRFSTGTWTTLSGMARPAGSEHFDPARIGAGGCDAALAERQLDT